MLRKVTIVLWSLVLIAGAWWVIANRQTNQPAAIFDENTDGRAFRDVPWKHFRAIPPFQLTERSGDPFRSESLSGRPYVVSFFFSTCPTICRELNRQIKRLHDQFRETELTFLSITVDPRVDTPEILRGYAAEFDADADSWRFLTGKLYKIREMGEQRFGVIVDKETHTGDILLVDRWGRYRDRFTWDDPREMKRFADVAREVLAESEPPVDESFRTRNVLAGIPHDQLPKVIWLDEFHLTDQHNQPMFSRDLTGQVWVGSFFFTTCPGICPRQNQFLLSLEPTLSPRNAVLVSITTDPQTDIPAKLRQYANQLGAGEHWKFLTGSKDYIRRIGSEFLGLVSDGEHHSTQLAVVDRWGNVRARVDWQRANSRQALLELIDELDAETTPPASWDVIELAVPSGDAR